MIKISCYVYRFLCFCCSCFKKKVPNSSKENTQKSNENPPQIFYIQSSPIDQFHQQFQYPQTPQLSHQMPYNFFSPSPSSHSQYYQSQLPYFMSHAGTSTSNQNQVFLDSKY